jgi:hypothetical protein
MPWSSSTKEDLKMPDHTDAVDIDTDVVARWQAKFDTLARMRTEGKVRSIQVDIELLADLDNLPDALLMDTSHGIRVALDKFFFADWHRDHPNIGIYVLVSPKGVQQHA